MMESRSGYTRAPHRGYALLIAISVLAILTILVTGLAASRQSALDNVTRADMQSEARRLARMGRDQALSQLKSKDESVVPTAQSETVVRESAHSRGLYAIGFLPVDSEATFGPGETPVYGAAGISYRPGDILVNVDAVVRNGRRGLRIRQVYLLNAEPNRERAILLMETQGGAP